MSCNAASYQALRERGGVADISQRVKLFLSGQDRVRYLNGQVTSNVPQLAPGQTQPACVTTAKGKLCAEVVITALPHALVIDAEASLHETLPARLERYIVADDVELQDGTDEWRLLHFLPGRDEPIDSAPAAAFGDLPRQKSRRFGRDGIDIFLRAEEAEKHFPPFAGDRVVLDESLAETLRIEAGIPRWGYELGADTLPPEAGLDRTHIDYHKGCYIGQEVISRLKSVGHVNRQLTGFVSEDGALLAPGMAIFTGDSAHQVGSLTSAAYSFALEKPIALGYLKRGSSSAHLFARPADSTGPVVRVLVRTLPFAS
jgi:tRNA-modifying protein YgfZ